jgi:ribosome biogenesis GTPase
VLDRRNSLVLPYVANVDQAFLVFARKMPDPDFNLLDRLLIQAGKAGMELIIIFTKSDLIEETTDPFLEYYKACGYKVLSVSNKTLEGIDKVMELVKGHITVLAGPSGSGKSSLLNCLNPDRKQKTGTVSEKIGRGKHTTRHVELISAGGGLVADTPGFSSLYLPEMKREQLQDFFPEFAKYKLSCRFKSCLHDKEPDCGVKEALANAEILASRYEHYIQFLQEVIAQEKKY